MGTASMGLLGGSVGGGELLLVLALILVLFGGERLPEIVRKLGRWTAWLQREAREFWNHLEQDAESTRGPISEETKEPISNRPHSDGEADARAREEEIG